MNKRNQNKTPVSIYSGYPFTEEWEVKLCKRAIVEAMRWGAKQDTSLAEQRHKNFEKFYSKYNGDLLAHIVEN